MAKQDSRRAFTAVGYVMKKVTDRRPGQYSSSFVIWQYYVIRTFRLLLIDIQDDEFLVLFKVR